jgi:hypothetical protein
LFDGPGDAIGVDIADGNRIIKEGSQVAAAASTDTDVPGNYSFVGTEGTAWNDQRQSEYCAGGG